MTVEIIIFPKIKQSQSSELSVTFSFHKDANVTSVIKTKSLTKTASRTDLNLDIYKRLRIENVPKITTSSDSVDVTAHEGASWQVFVLSLRLF